MIHIFNKKENKSIKIDESSSLVSFQPNDWNEENPHVLIELRGFYFSDHARTCEDCRSFQNALATESIDWYIEYLGRTKRLNLKRLGMNYNENQLIFSVSEYANGTKMKLNIDTDTIEILEEKLKKHIELENYEGCCIIRDKLKTMSHENIDT